MRRQRQRRRKDLRPLKLFSRTNLNQEDTIMSETKETPKAPSPLAQPFPRAPKTILDPGYKGTTPHKAAPTKPPVKPIKGF
jgi:hypothetical protein